MEFSYLILDLSDVLDGCIRNYDFNENAAVRYYLFEARLIEQLMIEGY